MCDALKPIQAASAPMALPGGPRGCHRFSVPHEPSAGLGDHRRLAGTGQLLGPASVDPQPKPPLVAESKVDQLHFERFAGYMVFQVQAVVRFGPWHVPLYPCKLFPVSQILIVRVNYAMHLPVHRTSSTTS